MSKIKVFSLMLVFASLSPTAFAESLKKTSPRIDFNKMIDENNHQKTKLQNQETSSDKLVEAKKKHKRKVIDFKDVEVGWGDDSTPLVDRRFDSVGEPRMIDLSTIVVTPTGS